MDIYIKDFKWVDDNHITFTLSDETSLKYSLQISCSTNLYYLSIRGGNYKLFNKLGIENKNTFAEKVLGYKCEGDWPEVKSVEDLKKVIDALLKYNNPKYCIKEDFIVEDYPVLPSEVLSFYNEDRTEVTFEKLKVNYILYKSSMNVFWWKPSNSVEESFIFDSLKIKEKNKWVKNIQGYEPSGGTSRLSFPESITKEDAYKVMDALIAEYIKQFQPKTTIKTNSYGDSKIELRRKKADVRVGSCPAGSIVYGKRSKASIRSRRVSYQTCIGN